MTRRFRTPTPATLISCLALFIALGAGAYAASLPRNSVDSRQLAEGAVRSVDIAPKAVLPKHLGFPLGGGGLKIPAADLTAGDPAQASPALRLHLSDPSKLLITGAVQVTNPLGSARSAAPARVSIEVICEGGVIEEFVADVPDGETQTIPISLTHGAAQGFQDVDERSAVTGDDVTVDGGSLSAIAFPTGPCKSACVVRQ